MCQMCDEYAAELRRMGIIEVARKGHEETKKEEAQRRDPRDRAITAHAKTASASTNQGRA